MTTSKVLKGRKPTALRRRAGSGGYVLPSKVLRRRKPTTPLPLVALAAIALAFAAVPILSLAWRVPWSSLGSILGRSQVLDALGLSAVTSFAAAGVCLLIGLPLAQVMAAAAPQARRVLRVLVLLPMVLPPVVGGAALLFALGRNGLVGQWIERWWGVSLPFTTAGAVVAAAFVALPFFVVSVETGIRQSDPKLAEVARTLGASNWRVFGSITLPLARPAVLSGLALSWARALGEFGATITFAGNLPGRTQTLPLATFLALESGRIEETLALSLLLLGTSAAVLIALRSRWLAV